MRYIRTYHVPPPTQFEGDEYLSRYSVFEKKNEYETNPISLPDLSTRTYRTYCIAHCIAVSRLNKEEVL
jgi:hypothetical protein